MDEEVGYYQDDMLRSDDKATLESGTDGIIWYDSKVRFEIFGEEMVEKTVKLSGNSGRAYLPPLWLGHKVKIVRID